MILKEKINQDLKTALLAGDKVLVTTLRGLKSVILYAEVATGKREAGLEDVEIIDLLGKEAKKRQESADLYIQGGNQKKADEELTELKVIENYLPKQIDDEELAVLVDKCIADIGELTQQTMGRVIGRVKELTRGGADGGRIAAAVKQRLDL